MSKLKNKTKILFYFLFINFVSMVSSSSSLDSLINKYEAIVENLEQNTEGKMVATKEISTNKQILILPTSRIISSEENYQFKEYFSRSSKEKLVGRLLIERFIGNASYYYEYIDTLPKPSDLVDYYHYTDANKQELDKRSLIKFTWSDRRNDYETLIRKIPSNEIPSNLLNFEYYSWAMTIVDQFGVSMKKKYYSEVKRLSRVFLEPNINEECVLIPGINLFQRGTFKSLTGINTLTSIFAYKEHIYLNSDRFIDEGGEVLNEIHFIPNVKLFQVTGTFVTGYHHEEMNINLQSNEWTLKKYNLCKELECFPRGSSTPNFILKYEFNSHLLNFCQIDQLEDKDEPAYVYKILKTNRKISDANYMKSLAKCSRIIKEYLKNAKKTSIVQDIKDLLKKQYTDVKDRNAIGFALSQKKILYNHIKLFNNRILKEFNNDIFVNMRVKYV